MPTYLEKFAHLRTDRTGGWTSTTRGQAPHKPLLLLSVLDLFAQGRLPTNLIEITPEFGELFANYWGKVMTPERRGNLALPFFHLRSSGFWHLVPQPGQEMTLQTTRQVDTLSQLGRLILGARLDEALYALLQTPETRDPLRTLLIQTYFAPEIHPFLRAQGQLNWDAFLYSQHLLEKANKEVKDSPSPEETYQPVVRDQGFRRVIVRLYQHRCAFCGIRMLTVDGRTAVDAAHIIPWSLSHDDDPHNGMALCGLCHWSFDQGLLGVTAQYLVILSAELRSLENMAGHLLTLESRSILGPTEPALWPWLDALAWHRKNVFRKA
ncbi:MAG TPA: HNH endonuclease [Anaerolineales bacterium]|nr:HNH endonuclease [Anaerolineales bacterium]